VSTQTKTIIQILVAGFGISFAFYDLRPAAWTLSNIVGLVLLISGFVLWVTARVQLGNSFSVSARATELVTHGLYARMRNPVYVFGLFIISGFILAIGKPVGLLVLLVIVPIQVKRAHTEAQVLEDKFGDAYREYRRKTWF
jgi:protein-S-isoprenylcysteine O-methyltransferase Ste14